MWERQASRSQAARSAGCAATLLEQEQLNLIPAIHRLPYLISSSLAQSSYRPPSGSGRLLLLWRRNHEALAVERHVVPVIGGRNRDSEGTQRAYFNAPVSD